MEKLHNLAERLKWARTQKDLSQEQLAKAAGVSQGTIGNLESGIRDTARKITSIAAAAGVDPTWLAEGVGSPDKSVARIGVSDETLIASQLNKIVTAFLGADHEGRAHLLRLADAIETQRRAGAVDSAANDHG